MSDHQPETRSESEAALEDGVLGPRVASLILANQILDMSRPQAATEIATILRALWALQRQGGHPTYPSRATRERWSKVRAQVQRRRMRY